MLPIAVLNEWKNRSKQVSSTRVKQVITCISASVFLSSVWARWSSCVVLNCKSLSLFNSVSSSDWMCSSFAIISSICAALSSALRVLSVANFSRSTSASRACFAFSNLKKKDTFELMKIGKMVFLALPRASQLLHSFYFRYNHNLNNWLCIV